MYLHIFLAGSHFSLFTPKDNDGHVQELLARYAGGVNKKEGKSKKKKKSMQEVTEFESEEERQRQEG